MKTLSFLALLTISLAQAVAQAGNRDVQFVNILTDSRVLMLFNSGSEPISLDGWQFCTQSSTVVRVYTSPSGLNGVTIAPSTAITIHLNDDANPDVSTQHNASDIGAFAGFELGAYSLSLYFPNAAGFVNFGDGNLMADFLQWSVGGVDNPVADERSDEAEAGGVWSDQSAWIDVSPSTVLIELIDPTFAELHGPDDYHVINSCAADLNGDGVLNFFDVSAFLTAFSTMDPAADLNNDGLFNFFDVSSFLGLFAVGCP